MESASVHLQPAPSLLVQLGFQPLKENDLLSLFPSPTEVISTSREPTTALSHVTATKSWDNAYLLLENEVDSTPIRLDLNQLNKEHLLGSLNQVSEHFDRHTANRFKNTVDSLLNEVKQNMDFPPNQRAYLILEGGLEAVCIELARLEKQTLLTALEQALISFNPAQMSHHYEQMGVLVQAVRSGVAGRETAAPTMDQQTVLQLMALVNSSAPFQLEPFLSHQLGFNSNNEIATVQALLKELQVPSLPKTDYQMQQLRDRLREKVTELAEIAKRLQENLALTEVVEGDALMQLLQAFINIIRELDRAMTEILTERYEHLKLERNSLKRYAEQLHQQGIYQQETLDKLSQQAKERLLLALKKRLDKVIGKANLATSALLSSGHSSQQDLLKVLGELKKGLTLIQGQLGASTE